MVTSITQAGAQVATTHIAAKNPAYAASLAAKNSLLSPGATAEAKSLLSNKLLVYGVLGGVAILALALLLRPRPNAA